MHNAAFAASGIDAAHVPLDVAGEEDLLWAADVFALLGVATGAESFAAGSGTRAVRSGPAQRVGRRDGHGGWDWREIQGAAEADGLEALVRTAAEQFEWWTGAAAPAVVMRDAARRHMATRQAAAGEST
jgi:shikimate 5-dehydrogenase